MPTAGCSLRRFHVWYGMNMNPMEALHGADLDVLSELLGAALTPARFLTENFDQQPVLLERAARMRPPDEAVLRLDEMDELLVRASLPASPSELLIFQDQQHVTEYATPHIAYASGASLIINRCDKVWPRVHWLCLRLARAFRYSYANVYLTPPSSQTVPPHSDDHDVFIMQLHGSKHWLVWPTAHPCAQRRPFADEQAGKDGRNLPDASAGARLTLDQLGPPELRVLLQPGDVLYIPRGVVHVAHTGRLAADGSYGGGAANSAKDRAKAAREARTSPAGQGGGQATTHGADQVADASGALPGQPPGASLHVTVAIPTAELSASAAVLHAMRAACFGERRFREALPLGPMPPAPSRAIATMPCAPAPPVAARTHAQSLPTAMAPATLATAREPRHTAASVALSPASSATVRVRLTFDPGAKQPTSELLEHHACRPTGVGSVPLGVWRERFHRLWARVHHKAAEPGAVRAELDRRMQLQRRRQADAFGRSEAAFAQLVASSGGADARAVSLCAATVLTKLVPLELLTPEPDWPENDLRRVAQAMPLPGGPGKLGYIHAPADLFRPLEAFASLAVGQQFALSELPARDDLLRACAARSLFGLGVVSRA